MSPRLHFIDTLENESTEAICQMSDMRRVSLSLAYSPARQRRRQQMKASGKWLRTRLGVHRRR